MKIIRTYLLPAFVILSPFAHAEIYKWVDEKGVVHFSQQKPTQVQEAEEIQVRESNISKPVDIPPIASNTSDFANNRQQSNKQNRPSKAECTEGLKRYYAMFDDAENNYSGAEKKAYIAMLNYKIAVAKKACYGS